MRSFSWILAGLILAAPGCRRAETEAETGPEPQAALGVGVRLSEAAGASIGLRVSGVGRQSVQTSLATAGWLIVKPGSEVIVKAATTGFVVPAEGMESPKLGSLVAEQQSLGTLRMFLSPQDEAQMVALKEKADILIRQSLASLQIAEDRYQRAKSLQGGVLADKDVQAILEAVQRSRAAYEEAREQLPFLPREPYRRPLQLEAIEIASPMKGRITAVHVRPRQLVVQADPLWTISDWSSLWVRVPVFEGDLPRIQQRGAAEVTVEGVDKPIRARPTGVPQPTQEGRRTVDLLYEIENGPGTLRPGQAVWVRLPTGQAEAEIVVPRSAIIWDGLGNAWVYVEQAEGVFRRRRVELGQTVEDGIVVEQGLAEGERVVRTGAEALYGEEFKSQIPLEDEDD